MGRNRRILLRTLAAAALVAGAAVLATGFWIHHRLSACLPALEGRIDTPGLTASVRVDRDARGVPYIHAANRLDAARALGWLHGQERFFQMDLMRRRAAGELAELFGPKALPLDEATRPYEFRHYAELSVLSLPPARRALLEAYAGGVNAGLRSLGAPPWEYALLRETPKPWTPADSLLCGYAMILTLEDPGRYEASLALLRDIRGKAVTDFFAPLIGPEDDAFDGSRAPLPPVPGPGDIDLRATQPSAQAVPVGPTPWAPGSNAFAISGARTGHGAGMLANDMHLDLAVPCTWYQTAMAYPDSTGHLVRLAGITLPGSPLLICGSNGYVAWGLTNSFADTADLVPVAFVDGSTTRYRTASGEANVEIHRATIAVKGAAPVMFETRWTQWGPVLGQDDRGRPYALQWTALDRRAINLAFEGLSTAQTVAEALAIAQRSGVPSVNFVTADRAGSIGWTVAGPLPRRVGFDGRFPTDRTAPGVDWDGWLPPSEHPEVVNPATGAFSSANERLFGGAILSKIGDGGYESAYRGAQLRADTAALASSRGAKLRPADLLAVQLDDRALHLERWRQLLLRTLYPETAHATPQRAELQRLASRWEGRADARSAAYTLVRDFRTAVMARVLEPVFAPCERRSADFTGWKFHTEPAVWRLLETRPMNLLAPGYRDWDALLFAAADDVIARDAPLDQAAWGKRNRAHIVHPFARLLPGFVARWISMPEVPLDGDSNMPRVTAPDFGASERLVVEPGHEDEGILEMPGGESSNPLSPYFRASFDAWVTGKPVPLLPGPARWRLVLAPEKSARQPESH